MKNLLSAVSAWHMKESYHKALKDVAGHLPSLQRVDKAYDILTRDSIYQLCRVQDAESNLKFKIAKKESNGEITTYDINWKEGSCTCPDAAQSNLCKHRLAVKIVLDALRLNKGEK